MADFDTALHLAFTEIFGEARRVEAPSLDSAA